MSLIFKKLENVYFMRKTKRVCQNDASSFSLYNHRFAIFHRV